MWLINELDILRALDSKHLIKLYEVYESETEIIIVTELLKGGDLFKHLLDYGTYNERKAAHLIQNLLQALTYIHSQDIIHRDIKPENLIVKSQFEDTDIKITDFGLSTFKGERFTLDKCGTPGYVAPEVLREEPYNEKVDIFSAGVILYIMYPLFTLTTSHT